MYRRFTSDRPDGALNGRSWSGAAPSVSATIAELEAAHGSAAEAMHAAQIPRSTWGHLKRGRTPSAVNLARLRAAQRLLRMKGNATRYRIWPGIVVHAQVVISSDDRERKLNVGRWTDGNGRRRFDAVQRQLVDAWLNGRYLDAAALFEAPIEAALGMRPGEFAQSVNVYDIRWFSSQGGAQNWVDAP